MDAAWPQERWMGKRNREDVAEPVRRLRVSAQRLRAAARSPVRLRGTKPGAALRDEPTRMWQHVAERLVDGTAKDPFTCTTTPLLLLAAAGRVDDEQLAAVRTVAGWSGQGGTGRHRSR